LALIEVL